MLSQGVIYKKKYNSGLGVVAVAVANTKAGAFSFPISPFLAHLRAPKPKQGQQRRRAGGEAVESLSLARSPCRKHASALFISPAGNAGAGAVGILLHCAGEHPGIPFSLSRPLQFFFSLRARLRLRRARSMPVLGFRSVLSAALTGCDPKGGCLARDLGRFAPLCVHPG